LLVERVGTLRATEVAMLADDIGADAALRLGLVNEVVDDAQLAQAAGVLAQRLAAGPTRAYGAIKEALQAWSADALPRQMEREGDLLQCLSTSPDFHEGKAAFVERRKARFTGS
jgi:2-(1,2-epoxy-1,2-dihydrophenyl)acetyl-CoA isomerase